jgi:lipid A 4'-phosphatase
MWAAILGYESDDTQGVHERNAQQSLTAQQMLSRALAVGAAASVLFLVVPGIDLAIGGWFYRGDRQFIGYQVPLFGDLRFLFNSFFYLTCALTLVGLFVAGRTAGTWLELRFSKWLFLALCLVIGPLVVTNIGLKDHWGRARPRDVVEFGGSKAFTPPIPPSEQCQYNCSFVSGEASSVFIVFFAAAFLITGQARNLVTAGIVAGGAAGLVRMAQGGHFLSDVVFAGVLMALVAAAVQLLFDIIESGCRAERAEALGEGPA